MNPATRDRKRRIRWIHVLPMLELPISGIIPLSNLEGGNLVYLDFTVSIAAAGLAWPYAWPRLWFGGLGTLWWYLLSFVTLAGIRAIFRIGQKT